MKITSFFCILLLVISLIFLILVLHMPQQQFSNLHALSSLPAIDAALEDITWKTAERPAIHACRI